MANLLSRASSWLSGAMQDAAGVAVTYTRAGTPPASLTLTAWVGRTVFSIAQPNGGGNRVEWGERDYLIPAASLTLGEPARGDRVTEVLAEGMRVFEVMAPAGEPAWRWSDQARTVYRVHTKRVA